MATWLEDARGWVERTGRDVRRKSEELERTYRPVVENAAAAAAAKLEAHREALARVGWRAALEVAPKKAATAPRVTGAQRAVGPELRGTRTPPRYLVDPSRPENANLLVTRDPKDPSRAYINPLPASNLGVAPWSNEELVDRMKAFAGGAHVDVGPRITFVNDQPKNPSPNQSLTVPTAQMAASAIWDSGVDSVNINSTTGGHKDSPKSWHNFGRAVDINRINGEPVISANPSNVRALQDAFLRQPNIGQDLGPIYNLIMPGQRPVRSQRTIDQHKSHVHGGGLR